jgi:hypothetical protein
MVSVDSIPAAATTAAAVRLAPRTGVADVAPMGGVAVESAATFEVPGRW